MTIYTRSERADDARLKNNSGGALVENQLVVLGARVYVANGVIADGHFGGFGLLSQGEVFEVAAADLKSGEDTFLTENQAVYFDPLTSKISDTATDDYIQIGILQMDKDTLSSPDGGIVVLAVNQRTVTAQDASGEFISGTATLTAAAAATPVTVIAASKVAAGKKFYPLGLFLKVNGATAWADATATIVRLKDTNGTPVVFATFAKAQLTGNAILDAVSTGVTLGTAMSLGLGLTAAKGVVVDADAVFGAGSDIVVTVFGIVK